MPEKRSSSHTKGRGGTGRAGRGRALRAAVLLCGSLALLSSCAPIAGGRLTAAQSDPSSSPSAGATAKPLDLDQGDATDLFSEQLPKMVKVKSPAKTRGELVVPASCKAKAAGLRRFDDGFLLVVRMEGAVPAVDDPPVLPFGNVLLMHEIHLGVFENNDVGGGYGHVRQYQLPDRPGHRKTNLGSGKDDVVESVDVDVSGNEFRIAVPSVGEDTDRVVEWGVRVNCVLRHPVEGIYFPSTRIPLGEFKRLKLG